MAEKVQTLFIDDLDGSEADGTVRFGLDSAEYEIDLNTGQAPATVGGPGAVYRCRRRARGSTATSARGARKVPAARPDTAEVREWVKAQGMEVKDRGRIPADLVARFNAATGK